MALTVDPDLVRSIASSCLKSSNTIDGEAQNMNSQMQQLHDALSGLQHVNLEDRFNEWSRLFNQLSESLQESHRFLNSIADRVDDIIRVLNQS